MYIFIYSANPNKVDMRGCTPLHVAATYGNSEALELLIEYKASMWALDDRGFHPARVAAQNKRLDCSRILDNIALQANAFNPDFVRAQQTRALKELQKRLKEREKMLKKQHFNSAPRIKTKTKSSDKKLSQDNKEEGTKNFVLLEKNEKGSDDEEDEDGDSLQEMVAVSGKNTLRPLPKMTSGAMLNTFTELAKQPMNIEYPDELKGTGSEPLLQRRQRQGSGKAIGQMVPLDTTDLEFENDSPLATLLHSIDLHDVAQILIREKIDLETLSLCSEDDLRKVDGLQFGPVKKIHNAVIRRNEIIKTPLEDLPMISTDL